jgi:HD superfamily phosphodiesterase
MQDDRRMTEGRVALVAPVEAWVRERLEVSGTVAHGWLHTDRVRRNILALARAEGVDPVLAELAALLHDVGRTQPGPEEEHGARSAALAAPLLSGLPLTDDQRAAVFHAVRWHNSARGDTKLLLVLRDADMLDGLGAIGLMRAFMSKAHLLPYDPEAPFDLDRAQWPPIYTSDQIRLQSQFYDWLNTETARRIAQDRVALMVAFVDQARREVQMADH